MSDPSFSHPYPIDNQALAAQLEALDELPPDWAVKVKPGEVKGAFTSGNFVTYQLNRIFRPNGWSFEIQRFEVITLSEANAYVRCIGRLTTRFADGSTAVREDAGVWPVRKSRWAASLAETAPDVFETAEKGAVTDCLKACAEQLGLCFRPLLDQDLAEHIRNARAGQRVPATHGDVETEARVSRTSHDYTLHDPASAPPVLPAGRELHPALALVPPAGGHAGARRRAPRYTAAETTAAAGPTAYRPDEVPSSAGALLEHVDGCCRAAGVAGYADSRTMVRELSRLLGQALPPTRAWTGELVADWTQRLVEARR